MATAEAVHDNVKGIRKIAPKTPRWKQLKAWQASYIEAAPYKRRYQQREAIVDAKKAAVVQGLLEDGHKVGDAIEFDGSQMTIQASETVNVDAMLIDLLNELGLHNVNIAALGIDVQVIKKRNTKIGDPFLRAPQMWAGKA